MPKITKNKQLFTQLYFKDTRFADLMQSRIYNVLLIASKYDAFMLEDDGRVDERIFFEYVQLNLRYPPRFTQVINEEDALEELSNKRYDLVIAMPNDESQDMQCFAQQVKSIHDQVPFVVLTPFSRKMYQDLSTESLQGID